MNSLKNELCNEMSVVQGLKNGILSGTHKIDISLKNGITASIFQAGKRIINIHSTKQISKEEIFAEFEMLEKLLMLFDGRFYPIEQLSFDNNDDIIGIAWCAL